MLYRKDLVKKAGYSPEKENWATESMRWKKFSKIVADTKRQSGVNYGFGLQANIYEGLSCCDFNEFMTHLGSGRTSVAATRFSGPVGERPVTVNEQSVVNAVKMLRTFIFGSERVEHSRRLRANLPEGGPRVDRDSSLSPFTAGNMVAHTQLAVRDRCRRSRERARGDKLGVMPIPYATTEKDSQIREYRRADGRTRWMAYRE